MHGIQYMHGMYTCVQHVHNHMLHGIQLHIQAHIHTVMYSTYTRSEQG